MSPAPAGKMMRRTEGDFPGEHQEAKNAVGTNWEKYSAWQGNLRRLGMEDKGGRQPLRSSGRAGDGVLGSQGKEDGARGRSGRKGVKVRVEVRQLTIFTLGAVQTQVTG